MTMHLFISISMLIHILVDAASGVLKVEVKIPVDQDSIKLVIFLEFDWDTFDQEEPMCQCQSWNRHLFDCFWFCCLFVASVSLFSRYICDWTTCQCQSWKRHLSANLWERECPQVSGFFPCQCTGWQHYYISTSVASVLRHHYISGTTNIPLISILSTSWREAIFMS